MPDKITSNFSVTEASGVSESNLYRLVLDNNNISDITDLGGSNPFNDLCEKEEQENDTDVDYREVRVESISGLLSFLFKPVRGFIPSPREIALRAFILCYSIRPEIIDGMSLSTIGKLFDTSRQTISARLIRNDQALSIRARTRKSDTASAKYREVAQHRWDDKKARERYLRERDYDRAYKSQHRDRLNKANADYYQKNRERILRQRRARKANPPTRNR